MVIFKLSTKHSDYFLCIFYFISIAMSEKINFTRFRRGANVVSFDMFGLPKFVSSTTEIENKASTNITTSQKRTSASPLVELLEKSDFKSAIHDSVMKRTLKYNLVTEPPIKWPKDQSAGQFQVVIPNQDSSSTKNAFNSPFSFSLQPQILEVPIPTEENFNIEREINELITTKMPPTTVDFASAVSQRFHFFGFEPLPTEKPTQISKFRPTALPTENFNNLTKNDNQKSPTEDSTSEAKPPSASPDNFSFSPILSAQKTFQQFSPEIFTISQPILSPQKSFQQFPPEVFAAPGNNFGSQSVISPPNYPGQPSILVPPPGNIGRNSIGQTYAKSGSDLSATPYGSRSENPISNGAYIPSGQSKNSGGMTCYCPCPGGYMIAGSSYQASIPSTNSPCSGKVNGNELTNSRHSIDTGGTNPRHSIDNGAFYIFGPPLKGG